MTGCPSGWRGGLGDSSFVETGAAAAMAFRRVHQIIVVAHLERTGAWQERKLTGSARVTIETLIWRHGVAVVALARRYAQQSLERWQR
jgi:hypothetical protein